MSLYIYFGAGELQLSEAANYRCHINGRDYYINHDVQFHPNGGTANLKDLVSRMDRGNVDQGGPRVSSGWWWAHPTEMANSNHITNIEIGDEGTRGWIRYQGGPPQYVGQGFKVHFAHATRTFDNNSPKIGTLGIDLRPIGGCGNIPQTDLCRERLRRAAEGLEPGDGYIAHIYLKDSTDADVDLKEAFFYYKDVYRNKEGPYLAGGWRHIWSSQGHNFGVNCSLDKANAWVNFGNRPLGGPGSALPKPGLYEFTAYAEDKGGRRSKKSNAVRVQLWGPPEIQHVQVAPEEPMLGQEVTVSIDFFDPNGDLARYKVEMWEAPEGEVYTLKEAHKADFPKKGARSHMAYNFHPKKPGRYQFKAECWDARSKNSQVFEQILTVESVPEVVYGTLEDGRPAKSLTDKRSLLASLIKNITSSEQGDLELVVSTCEEEMLCLDLNSRTEEEDPKSIFQGRYLTSGDAFVIEADAPESLLATVEDGGRSLVFEFGDEDSEEGTVRLVLYPSGDIQIEELHSKGVLRIKTPGNITTGPAEAKALFLNGKTIVNDAHLEADALELTASEHLLNGTQKPEGAHLFAKESATLSAQHFENHGIVEAPVLTLSADNITNGSDSNEEALGKLTTRDLELACNTGTNYGLIGPYVSLEETTTQVATGVLRFKVGAFTNAKAIHGSILEFTISGRLGNTVSGLINPASQLIVAGDGVFSNAGEIKTPGSVELRMAGLDNTGNIIAEGGIAFYEGAQGTSNSGTLASASGEISIRTNGAFLNKAGSMLTAKNLRIDQKSLDNSGTIKVLDSGTIGLASLINEEPGIIRGEHFDLRACASFVNHGHFQPESLDGELMSIQGAGTVSIGKLNIDVQTDISIENTLTCRDTCTLSSTGHIINKGSLFALSESCIDQDDCTDESHFTIHAAQGFVNEENAVLGSTGTLRLTASEGDIVNKGKMHARKRIELDTPKGLINSGQMNGAGTIVASSGDYMSNLPFGEISMGGHFNGTTLGTFLNQGKIKTLGQGHIKAGTIRNDHLIDLREPSTLEADTIENFNQALPGKEKEGTLLDLASKSKVQANKLLHNRGSIRAADDSIIKGKRIFNDGAAASIFGSSKLTIEAEEEINNISAQILSLGLLHLHAKKIINDREYSSPELISKGQVEIAKIIARNLILEGHDLINHTSVVYAYEDLLAYIDNIINQGMQKTHQQEIPKRKKKKRLVKELPISVGSSTSGGGYRTIVDGIYESLLAAGGNVESVLGHRRWSHGMFNESGHRVINEFARIVAGKKITFTEDDVSGIIEYYNSICENIGLIQVSVDFNRLYKGEALQTVLTDPYGSPLSSRYLSPEENSEFAYVCNFQQGIDDLINQGYMTEEFVYARPAAFATDEKTAHILKRLESPPRFFLDPVLEAHSMMVTSMVYFGTPHLLKGSSNVLDESLKLSGKAIELAGRQEALPYSAETILLSDPDQAEALESSSLQRMNEAGGLVNIGGLQVESGMWVISDETIRTSEEIFKYYTLGVLETATGRILEHEDPAQYLVPVHKKIAKDKETSREASPETETQYRLATPAGLEVVMVPILAIPNNFVPLGGSIDLTTPNFIGGGEGTEINSPHANVHNAGSIGSALGDVEINVASFINEKPVYTYETGVSGKGLLGGSFRQTFEVRIPQPGGEVIGVNIRIRSVNDIENKGGLIAAEKEVEIFSEHGDIRNLAQRYSEVVEFDVGKLGALLGKKPAALKEFLVPGTISAGGSLNLTSEDGSILFVASEAFADAIHLKAKEGIDIQGETTTYTYANKAGLRGITVRPEYREQAMHFPSRFIARDSITLESSEGDITVQGSYIIAGGDITQKAGRDNIVKVDRVRLKSSSSKAGFTTFGYTSSKTTVSGEKLYPSFYIAGGNIRLEADRDNRLEALIIDAGEAIELISGRDTIITAAEAQTNVETKSNGFSLDFFASEAIKLADDGASNEAIIKSLIAEDPLGAALLGYDHIGDWQDALATTTNVGVQTYRLLYSLARVNGQAIDGIVPTRFGTIGQRLGLTDAAGKFRPRVTLRLGKSRSTQETVELLEANLHGQRIYIRAGEDIWVNGGAQIIAEADIELDAGGDIHTEPGEQTQTSSSWNRGVSGSIGGGLLPGIGIDGTESSSQAMANKHNLLKAGSKVILRSKGGQYYKGTVVEAPEIEVNAKRLVIESVVDTTQSSSWAGSINSEGSLFASESKSSSAWVNTVSGFKATDNMSIVVDETMELIGAVVDGPDGKTYIESGSFCYSNIQEYSNSKSTSVNAGFIWHPFDTDYRHKVDLIKPGDMCAQYTLCLIIEIFLEVLSALDCTIKIKDFEQNFPTFLILNIPQCSVI